MRPRPIRRARPVLVGIAALVLVSGCGGLFTARSDPGPALPTPQASLSTVVATAAAELTAALGAAGIPLFPPTNPARPSEPESLTQVPRAVLQAGVGDPNVGYVVIYQLADDNAATAAATELAGYLSSGFGQTNFPVDTQFHVATLGPTVILTWWSRERAADDELAENAFEAIATVGTEVPVVK